MSSYTFKEDCNGNGWLAKGNPNSGILYLYKNTLSEELASAIDKGIVNKEAQSGYRHGEAIPSPKCEFLRIKQGMRNNLGSIDPDTELGEAIVYALAFKLFSTQNPIQKERYFEAFIQTTHGLAYLALDPLYSGKNHGEYLYSIDGVNPESVVDNFIKEETINLINIHGAEIFDKLSQLTKIMITKRSEIEPESESIVRIIGGLAKKLDRVPYKKEVKEIWLKERTNRSERQFTRNLKSLGFEWLPIAPKGKNNF